MESLKPLQLLTQRRAVAKDRDFECFPLVKVSEVVPNIYDISASCHREPKTSVLILCYSLQSILSVLVINISDLWLTVWCFVSDTFMHVCHLLLKHAER